MNPQRVLQILDRLPKLVVELDPDPTSRGPAHLQKAIFTTRSYLNETGVMIQEVLRHLGTLESDLNARETLFQIRSDDLMATDKRVKALPAVRDREAMINVIEREARAEILKLGQRIREAQAIEKAIRHRHRELEHTMSAIRLQRSLIQTEIKTGAFYGDETSLGGDDGHNPRSKQPPKDPELDERSLDAIFNSAMEAEEGALSEGAEDSEEVEDGTEEGAEDSEEVEEGAEDSEETGESVEPVEESVEPAADSEVDEEEPLADSEVDEEEPAADEPEPETTTDALLKLAELDFDDVNLDDHPPLEPEPKSKGKKAQKSVEPALVTEQAPVVEQDLRKFDSDATLSMGEYVLSMGEGDSPVDSDASPESTDVDPAITQFLDGPDAEEEDDLSNIFDEL